MKSNSKQNEKLEDKKNEFKEKESYCRILEKKIKELNRLKKEQKQTAKLKKEQAEMMLKEEEWDSRFDSRQSIRTEKDDKEGTPQKSKPVSKHGNNDEGEENEEVENKNDEIIMFLNPHIQ